MALITLIADTFDDREIVLILHVDLMDDEAEAPRGAIARAWASPADVVVDAGAQISAGLITPTMALTKSAVVQYVDRLRDRFGLDNDLSDEEVVAEYLDCFAHALDTESFGAFYGSDSDEPLADAARALKLPSWAKLVLRDDGGVGLGYEQPVLIIPVLRGLDELRRSLVPSDRGRVPTP